MRFAILTNTDQRCGNAEYGRNLYNELQKKVEVAVFRPEEYKEAALYADVVFVNWHPARVHVDCPRVRWMKNEGQAKVVLIFQNSRHEPVQVEQGDLLDLVDAVVSHEPFALTMWNGEGQFVSKSVEYIPHGIPVVDGLLDCPWADLVVGTAGFPFSWKGVDLVVDVAAELGAHANLICPEYPGDAWLSSRKDVWRSKLGDRLRLVTDWMPEERVIRRLALSTVNIFYFQSADVHDEYGQTGSARLGLAARRPMVVSRHRKFRMLLEEYPTEVYIANSPTEVSKIVSEIWASIQRADPVKYPVRNPRRCLAEQSWERAGEKYFALAKRLLGMEAA